MSKKVTISYHKLNFQPPRMFLLILGKDVQLLYLSKVKPVMRASFAAQV